MRSPQQILPVFMTSSMLLYCVLLLCPILPALSCARYRGYGEPCIGYTQEVCDTRRLLKCDLRTGTCQCPDIYYYFFDSYQNRCYHKIGTACQESFGGTYESQYEHGCPANSYCNPGSGYCQCRSLFQKNYEGTACYAYSGFGFGAGQRTAVVALGMPLVMLMVIGLLRVFF